MLTKIKNLVQSIVYFLKKRKAEIILFLAVILVSLFSFAMGYIMAKNEIISQVNFENIERIE